MGEKIVRHAGKFMVIQAIHAVDFNVKLAQRRTVPLALWDNQPLASLLA